MVLSRPRHGARRPSWLNSELRTRSCRTRMSRPPERLMPRLSLTACCRMLEATERSLQAMRGRWSCLIRKKESFTGGAGVSIRSPGASWAGGARCWRVAVMAAGTSGWSSRPGWMTAAGGRAGAATPPETGDVRIPGVHAHPRDFQERAVLGPAQTDPKRLRARLKMVNDQIKQRRCQPIPRPRQRAGQRGTRAPGLLRRARQRRRGARLPHPGHPALVPGAPAP